MRAKVFIGLGLTAAAAAVAAQDAPAPALEFVFEETVTLGKALEVGKTARGERRIIPIAGGHFEGPHIKGEVMPGGSNTGWVRTGAGAPFSPGQISPVLTTLITAPSSVLRK